MQAFLRKLRLEGADVFVLLILLLAGLKFTFGISRVLDVALYDESFYLHSGASLAQNGLPPPAFAPLYALWYFALSLVQPDRIDLYYLNYVLTTILPPLFLYVLLRVNRVGIVTSVFLSAYFLITQANFVTWPRVSHLALIMMLLTGIAVSFARRVELALALTMVGALLASYVRPEYFLSVLILLAVGVASLIAHRRQLDRVAAALPLIASFLFTLSLLAIFGLPAFDKGGSERHFYAFAQHFALNWGAWNHISADNSYQPGTNFQEIAARYFGDATTVSAALRHNPGMFAKHILTNVTRCISRFPGLFFHHENVFLPFGTVYENMEARLTILVTLGFLYVQRRSWLPAWRPNFRRARLLLICLAIPCIPAFIVITEIFPHDHYLLVPGVLLIAGLAIVLFGRNEPAPALRPTHLCLLALIVLAATPSVSHRPAVDTPIAKSLRYIRSLGITKPVVELDAEGGYHHYQAANYRQVTEFAKSVDFDHFMSENGINFVVLTKKLQNDSHFVNDQTWHDFLAHSEERGFESRHVPGTDISLLVKRDLLPFKSGP